jgi:hypothetical protein
VRERERESASERESERERERTSERARAKERDGDAYPDTRTFWTNVSDAASFMASLIDLEGI